MRGREAPALALLFSAGMLAGAYAFEYIGGLLPCQMCWWQRWVHWGVLGVGLAGVAAPRAVGGRASALGPRFWGALAALGLLASFAVAGFHAGVEYGLWEGPQSCSAGAGADLGAVDPGAIFDGLSEPLAAVSCADAAWSFAGLSMAGWNAVLSLGAAGAVVWLLMRGRAWWGTP